ncbi:MAG: hypothetical protein P4L77_11860 [Sulfuriferula sp.]|nr:hypothetical protein [Sulfuriferula sp.]
MAVKPCQLVLIKRYPLDPKLRKDYEAEYCAGFEKNWVHFQSNAVLFNRSDVKRDVLPDLPNMPRHQIVVNGLMVETAFEMVELIEKKHFGWVIKQEANESYYLNQFCPGSSDDNLYTFIKGPSQALLLDTELKDTIMEGLAKVHPDERFKAVELFTQ